VGDVTRILDQMQQGDPKAAEELLPLVYEELRRLAAAKMAHEKPGQTLQATALVHEAWLRLAGPRDQEWKNKAHFFCAAAEAMRRILVDNARRKRTQKHGGNAERVDADSFELSAPLPDERVLALDEALTALSSEDPEAAELVKLRFFVGLPHREAAALMGLSHTKADQVWLFAKAWLAHFLAEI
jgi:RNA polymerase sigma factor (TIGR02999 family)